MTARFYLAGARVASAVAAAAALTVALSPRLLGLSSESAILVAAGAGYAAVVTAFAAAPRLRRDDLALGAFVALCACTPLRVALHEPHVFMPWAELLGVVAVWAPGKVETFRKDVRFARRTGDKRASDLARDGRRLNTSGRTPA